MDGFTDRLATAVRVSEDFYKTIANHPKVTIKRIPSGTNVAQLTIKDVDGATLVRRMAERGIRVPGVSASGSVSFGVNETWNRTTGAELARAFEQALG